MKAILISIKPKWVAKILNGEKTIEIRKSYPKCELPIDVYIYCTKDKPYLAHAAELFTGKYGCVSNDEISYEEHNINGKVVAKFTLNKVEEIEYKSNWEDFDEHWIIGTNIYDDKETCVSEKELTEYLDYDNGYAWHIDNLVIFDKPKELSEFGQYGYEWFIPVEKAPQSFCYIEVE